MQRQAKAEHRVAHLLTPVGQLIYYLAIAKDEKGLRKLLASEQEKENQLRLRILGGYVNASKSLIQQTTERDILESVDYSVGAKASVTYFLAKHGESEAIDFLRNKFEVDKETVLKGAIAGGQTAIFAKVFKACCSEKKSKSVFIDRHTNALVYFAARNKRYEILDFMLAEGVDVSMTANACLEDSGFNSLKINTEMPWEMMANFASGALHRAIAGKILATHETLPSHDLPKEIEKVVKKVAALHHARHRVGDHYSLTPEQTLGLYQSQKCGLYWLLHGAQSIVGQDDNGRVIEFPPELYMAITSYVLGLSDKDTCTVYQEVNAEFRAKHEQYHRLLSQQGFWTRFKDQAIEELGKACSVVMPKH